MNILTRIVTLLIAMFPWLAINTYRKIYGGKYISFLPLGWILLGAGVAYPVARFVPEPDLFAETRTFFQHAIGGGVVSFLYYLYCTKVLKWKHDAVLTFLYLFAFVSTLGAINELLEFAATKMQIYTLDGSDVWYDLFANSIGAFASLLIYGAVNVVLRHKN